MNSTIPRTNNASTAGIFWFWNADPTECGMAHQLRSIREAGFGRVCIHPMPESFRRSDFIRGMKIAYLGKTFFRRIRFAVEECRRLKLKVILYDEGGWPSGTALGKIVRQKPETAAWLLNRDATGKIEISQNRGVASHYPDLLSPKTTAEFLRMTHEHYYAALSDEFGRTVTGFFTDEPHVLGQLGTDFIPWSPEVADWLLRHKIDPEKLYPALFPSQSITPAIREKRVLYSRCLTELFQKNYLQPLAVWCKKHRVELEGHLNGEDRYEDHLLQFGNFLELADSFSIPGADAIWRQIFPYEHNGAYLRFPASAAIRNNRPAAQCEFGNVYGNYLTTPELSWIANTLLMRGINRLSLMPYLYRGGVLDQGGCCTDYSPRSPLWRLYPALTTHWNWAGKFHAGATESKVWIPYRPENADSPRLNQLTTELDQRQLSWRFAAPDELTRRPPQTIVCETVADLAPDSARQAGFLTLPCRREGEKSQTLMVFRSKKGTGVFHFTSENGTLWEELPPPDSTPLVLAPLRQKGNGQQVRFAEGELRIFRRTASSDVPERVRIPQKCALLPAEQWRLNALESFSVNERGNTVSKKKCDGRIFRAEEFQDFSGVLHLSATLTCEQEPPKILRFLALNNGGILRINGATAHIRAFAPWLFSLQGLKNGKNLLELELPFSAGAAWEHCFREKLQPNGLFNAYSSRILSFEHTPPRLNLTAQLYR